MNRKFRRAQAKSNIFRVNPASGQRATFLPIDDLMAQAIWHHQRLQPNRVEELCHEILAREPGHVDALNLHALVLQASGRHRAAVKTLVRALASDASNAACHYNVASSYQALGRQDEAAFHYTTAIALGSRQKNAEDLIVQNPTIAAHIGRIDEKWPFLPDPNELFDRAAIDQIADDIFLRCALQTILLRGSPLEKFLTALRAALLGHASAALSGSGTVDDAFIRLFCAVAEQCFINEYVFARSDQEARRSNELRELLQQKTIDADVPPLLLATVAAYFPLHALPMARTLLNRNWPPIVSDVLRRQVREPLQEADDLSSIPVLTRIDDSVSLGVMSQYTENPYPRWTVNPRPTPDGDSRRRFGPASCAGPPGEQEILIAGCGSGEHVFDVAQRFPDARLLAVDISKPSLAYARRMSRAAKLHNVEYGQADILELESIGRMFNRIEAIGVLHHLAEPERGWTILLSLLRPGGEIRLGLYSEAARRAIVEAREFIAARGYKPEPDDIRKCRQDILRQEDQRSWKLLLATADFYSMSGCRDLLFNVMEHRFTIPRIERLLSEHHLRFLGFEAEPPVMQKFQQHYPDPAALTALDKWHAFETANPQAFRHMYVFTARKD